HLGTIELSQTALSSFVSFEVGGKEAGAAVTVTCAGTVHEAKVLPASRGVVPSVEGNVVSFRVPGPGQYVVEVDGDWVSSLQLFVNPPDPDAPKPGAPNVIYFGPGIHRVTTVPVLSGQTVYVADGAVVYGTPGGADPGAPIFDLRGSHVALRGRGIVDGSLCPRDTRSIGGASGSDIRIEGVVLRDPCGFTFPIRRADGVAVENVKVLGWRGNSDGLDICNSRAVAVRRCYLRTFDDLVVVKTDLGQGEARDILVTRCVLWNEFAHALSLGAELREPVSNVRFADCDVIHDKGREWLMRVFNCDSAPVEGVLFRHIASVASSVGAPLAELVGADTAHRVRRVRFEDVVVGGQPLREEDVKKNAYVDDVTVAP
ncbi:MAG TPA: glycosyl hydrolase family 28 protein, partial [Candidatus Methylacidiphilales bacterium]